MVNYYEILNVSFHANEEEIKSSFRRLAKLYHPDTSIFPDNKRMGIIIQAYKVLTNEPKRKIYDQNILSQAKSTTHIYKNVYSTIPKKRIIYTSTLDKLFKNGSIKRKSKIKDWNKKLVHDVIIYINAEEQINGAIAKISLPARSICNVCFGEDRSCFRCNGIGRVVTVEELSLIIPPNVQNNCTLTVDLRKVKQRKLSFFTMKSLSAEIKVVNKV